MRRKRREGKTPRQPHPDPSVELKLRGIAGIARMQALAERQVRQYQDAIRQAHADDAQAMHRHSYQYMDADALEKVTQMNAQRRAEAEDGIRHQQELMLTASDKLAVAIASAGLTPDDLVYLDLSTDG